MVQEVQTGVGITNETTLETIEAIGTSSFRIVEGRQTRGGHYTSGCEGGGNASRTWTQSSGQPKLGPEVKGTLTINETYGKSEMISSNGGIRIPVAGTYQITISWGSSAVENATMILKAGGRDIYKKTLYGNSSETVTFQADLGKFDIIELWGQFEYISSGTSITMIFTPQPTITVKQL